jgi:tetratricopeptide (TPR) repeat protein
LREERLTRRALGLPWPLPSITLWLVILLSAVTVWRVDILSTPEQNENHLVEAAYAEIFRPDGNAKHAVSLFEAALQRDQASPFRWSDLAFGLTEAGDVDKARACYARAVRLGPHVPGILMRAAHFYLLQNSVKEALEQLNTVLSDSAEYDAIIFSYFDQIRDTPCVLQYGLPKQRRALNAYCQHLTAIGDASAAEQVCKWQSP